MYNIRVIEPSDKAVYRRLNRLSDPPRRLFAMGEYDPGRPAVAVVGSRKHSAYGKQVATILSEGLARAGITIVSGLALGIDSLSHSAAVKAGGRTVAVLPGGVDRVYPATHRGLARRLLEARGGLLSEYPPGSLPKRQSFVARNRIVAGLSDAVLVVEAAQKSGTLITAEYALDMGIPVMAVPGPITSFTSKGTNRLIDTGAKLVASVEDILMELNIKWEQASLDYDAGNDLGRAIVNRLKSGPMSANQLSAALKTDASQLNRELTHLELEAVVANIGNNTWSLRPDLPS